MKGARVRFGERKAKKGDGDYVAQYKRIKG